MSGGGGNSLSAPASWPHRTTSTMGQIVDFMALYFGETAKPDLADRARTAWELYRDESGGELQDLISDLLHLAHVDEHPGGAEFTATQALANYTAEVPEPPTEITGAHLAQTRPAGREWLTVAGGDDRRAAAEELRQAMQVVGLLTSEMDGHIDDLTKGYVLTSDGGHAFRVLNQPDHLA